MKLSVALLLLTLGVSGNPGDLEVHAEHAGGGFTYGTQWAISISGDRIHVLASDPARKGEFELCDSERQQLTSLLEETEFFDLKPRYGMGDMEGNSCSLTISLGEQKATVTLLMYSKSKPPNDDEREELHRAYRVWDAVKALGHLSDLPDDCRREFDIWEIP
jgi:hypothetical protein